MCDGEGGPALHQPCNRLLDSHLCLHVHRGGRLVQNQDPGVVEDGASQGNPLLLSHRQLTPPLSHLGVVAIGFGHDEIVGVRRCARLNDLIEGRPRLAVADVLRNGAAEQDGILQHDADLVSQVQKPNPADVHSVDLDPAAVHVVEPADQVDRRRLSHTRFAHQTNHLAGGHIEVDLVQDRLALVVAEGHLAEPYAPFDMRNGHRIGILIGLGRRIDHLEDPLSTRESPRHPAVHLTKPLQGAIQEPHIAVERQERAQRQPLQKHLTTTVVPHDEHAQSREKRRCGEEDRPVDLCGHGAVRQRLVPLAEDLDLPGLLGEGLDHPDTREDLVHPRHQVRPGLHPLHEEPMHSPPEHHPPQDDDRNGDKYVQRELPAHREQHPKNAQQHQTIDDKVGHPVHQEILEAFAVPRDPGHHGTHLSLVVVLERQQLESPVELAPDIGRHPCAQPGDRPPAKPLGAPGDEPDAHQGQDQKSEERVAIRGGLPRLAAEIQHIVHDPPVDQRGNQLRGSDEYRRDRQGRAPPPVGLQVGRDPAQRREPLDAGGADAVPLGQKPTTGRASRPFKLGLNAETLGLAQLLDPPRGLGELDGLGIRVGHIDRWEPFALYFEAPPAHERLRASERDRIHRDPHDLTAPFAGQDGDLPGCDNHPLRTVVALAVQINGHADQLLLSIAEEALDPPLDLVLCRLQQWDRFWHLGNRSSDWPAPDRATRRRIRWALIWTSGSGNLRMGLLYRTENAAFGFHLSGQLQGSPQARIVGHRERLVGCPRLAAQLAVLQQIGEPQSGVFIGVEARQGGLRHVDLHPVAGLEHSGRDGELRGIADPGLGSGPPDPELRRKRLTAGVAAPPG